MQIAVLLSMKIFMLLISRISRPTLLIVFIAIHQFLPMAVWAAPTFSCLGIFSDGAGSSISHRVYTAPLEHLEGIEVADKAIAEYDAYNKPGSVWLAFAKDPRFLNFPVNSSPFSSAIDFFDRQSKKWGGYNVYKPDIEPAYKQDAFIGGPAHFLVSWNSLGISTINRLNFHRIYPLALSDTPQPADGQIFRPPHFFGHDAGHAAQQIKLLEVPFNRLHQKYFNYDTIVRDLNQSDRVLFDIAYFDYSHEISQNVYESFSNHISKCDGQPTLKQLQKAYISTFHQVLDFEFEPELKVRISADGIDPRYATRQFYINRFLDKKHTWSQLPMEIQSAVERSPDQANKIVGDFLDESFTLFFRLHYKSTKEMLGIP